MNSMMHWRPTGVTAPIDDSIPRVISTTESRVIVAGEHTGTDGRSIVQTSGPPATRSVVENGRASLVWDATPGMGQVVEFSATENGQTRYGSVNLPSFGEVVIPFMDLSAFSGGQKLAMGSAAVITAGIVAYVMWPKKR